MSIGQQGQSFFGAVALQKEGSYGGATGGNGSYYLDVVSDGFQADNGVDYLNTIRSRASREGAAGEFDDSGDIDMPVGPEGGIGLLLLAAFGSETFTGQDPDGDSTTEVGEHVFTPADTVPSLGVELAVANIDTVLHKGVGVNELELSHAAGDRLTAGIDLPAQVPEITSTSITPSYSDLLTFMWHSATVSIAGTDRTPDVQEATVTVSNDMEGLTRGERYPGKMSIGERVVTAEVTLDFESMDLWERFFGSTGATTPEDTLADVAFNAKWTSPETIADTSTPYSLEVDMPRCRINTHQANLNQNDLVAEEVELRALVDASLGYDVEATLVNGVTQAY